MSQAQSFETVLIQHSCGHFVTYEIPSPRRVFHRSNAQTAQYFCESCKATPKADRPTTVTYEVIKDGYQVIEDSYQIAFVEGAYPIREELTQRGYEFIPKYFRTNHGAHVLNCTPEQGLTELDWVRQNGWKVEAVESSV